ncbi:ATP-dependent DNA helicase [Shimwellia blattae]|uniref:ATP-dependent DNA helicase YoaA n=1 Tax=Shimwellia blattae (strain ATCC 29907 / DSM 4481 / JCM 1650 / NBRC 105725 / CDC 9005-74) TaxID=630626 RepID=I2B8L3_SHIBC|nr:ATP-dependent DNA helicase [Shimwellia blattae]AFJ46867.1 putative ATP-dependent helicase SOS repair [Shimwellia blattae DSM 4481 = NBRC 105725]GAB82473.1 putative ATP-dependent helicase YoaA [Shimwellia blattae DSM 4481 = NBRC 105725]VDY64351.1 Probable ATP-dependent helicase dinG homolog [Shimwellia blattae]VEC22469.1 Probable ATP-dependent helicase dinG homolog [Shimwellia blattae]
MTDDFAAEGQLARAIPGFRPREPQRQMAQAVTRVLEQGRSLVVEAGTGTGKTYAYLAPALRAGKKVIISTGSKALQDQLYNRDLPTVARALEYTGTLALLKGRSNYLCLERLEQQTMAGGDLPVQTLTDLMQLRRWASETSDGDTSNCASVAEDAPVWPLVTSTNDNCLGSDCPQYKDCYVVRARKKAMDADVVVVNHHLFLADMVVKESGFAELIPESQVTIFDEAHQIPDIASQYFGQSLSSRQLIDLAKDITIAYRTELKDTQQLQKCADRLAQSAQDFRLQLGEPGYRGNLRELLADPAIQRALLLLDDALELCYDVAKLSLGRSALLDAAFERATLYRGRLKRLKEINQPGYSYWYECTSRHFTLALTPLTVAEKFQELIRQRAGSWVFTSATLSVNDDLHHFTRRLGIEDAETMMLPSPFDYAHQALLCVPRGLPQPNQPGGARQLARMLIPLIEANNGRCFMLCTSHAMMRDLAAEFRAQLTLPVLLQGETGKGQLLRQFVEAGNALLVATSSFWEGVDVRGDALSLVIIDKLPFTSPDDPLLKARMEDCRLRGGDPFDEVQLPDAVITLKQGVGRLIRDVDDRGVLVICDNRLVMRPYGAVFLNSLPPAPRTRDLLRAREFLAAGTALPRAE